VDLEAEETVAQQLHEVAEWIKIKRDTEQCRWSQIAVLFRFHSYEYPLALTLDKWGIPHRPVDGAKLFKSKPGQAVFAYLKAILQPEACGFSIVTATCRFVQQSHVFIELLFLCLLY